MSYQPSSILITGGCGFIGSNFINSTFYKWHTTRFINIDKLKYESRETNIIAKIRQSNRYKFIKGTVRDTDLLINLLRDYQIDTIIHFAAMTDVDKSYSDRIGTIEENVMSIMTLLEIISFRYNGIKRFLHISTDEVYGDSRNGSMPKMEYSLLNPTNPYAASKACCEMILNAYWHSYKVPFLMVRINNVYGPNQTLKLIPKFISLAVEGKPYPLMGDGMHMRSWIYVDDCTDAIRRVCEMGRIGEIYNIGTEFEISNYDVTMMIHQTVNELLKRNNILPKFQPIMDRPYHDRRYCIDFTKISRELGWKSCIAFKDAKMNKLCSTFLDCLPGLTCSNGQCIKEQ
ncbi:dTDP-glucose 4,6-dehydratase [Dirofilaria immitis]|nr:dTDP-glucose 4,6-dehydratase [Dirofilaria immitis]